MGKLGVFVGFGAGYVLGAKAGRERYEQLRRLYDNITASEIFKQASGMAKEAVGTGLGQAKDLATESVTKVRERKSGTEGPGLSVAPPPQQG